MARGLEGSSHMEFYTHVVFLEISKTIVMKFKLIGAKGGISCDRLSMDRAGRGLKTDVLLPPYFARKWIEI